MSSISFHFDCTYQWQYAQQIIASPNIRSALLMNTSPDQVAYTLQHVDFVVVRIFDIFNEYQGGKNPDFEKAILDRHSPSEFVAALDNQGFSRFKGNPKVRFVCSWNELYYKGGQAERSQNQKLIAVGTAMINAGYGIGLGAWAADKSFNQVDVDAGHWDDIIRFSVQHRDMASWDIHEYTVGRTANQHLKSYPNGYPETLLNPAAMQKDNFGSIPYSGNISGNYHMGRVAMVLVRSEQLTGQKFGFYRGECAHDFKDDGSLKEFIKNEFEPRFGKPSGINSLQSYYTHLAGGNLSNAAYNQMLYEDIEWLAKNDGGAIANFIFAHNGHSDWVKSNTANGNRVEFVTAIVNHRDETTIPDTPAPEFSFTPAQFEVYRVRSITGGNVRVRDTYGLNSVVLEPRFTPEFQDVALVHPNQAINQYPPQANGFTWVYVVFAGGISGWSAWELLEALPVIPPTQEPDYKAMVLQIRQIVN